MKSPFIRLSERQNGGVATTDWTGAVKLWNAQLDSDIQSTHAYFGFVSFSHDSSRVATGVQEEHRFSMRDSASGKERWRSTTHPGRVRFVRFSPESTFVVSLNDGDNLPRVWNVRTGELLHVLDFGDGLQVSQRAGAIAFSPLGTELATAERMGEFGFGTSRPANGWKTYVDTVGPCPPLPFLRTVANSRPPATTEQQGFGI